MQSNILRSSLQRLAGAALVAATISLTGCAAMRGSADSESSFMPDWSNVLELPPADSEKLGLSNEAREIESSLGFK